MSSNYYRKFQKKIFHYVVTGLKIRWKIMIFGLFRVYRADGPPKLYQVHIYRKAFNYIYQIKKELSNLVTAVPRNSGLKMCSATQNFTHFGPNLWNYELLSHKTYISINYRPVAITYIFFNSRPLWGGPLGARAPSPKIKSHTKKFFQENF